jgi:hypothetical protein
VYGDVQVHVPLKVKAKDEDEEKDWLDARTRLSSYKRQAPNPTNFTL